MTSKEVCERLKLIQNHLMEGMILSPDGYEAFDIAIKTIEHNRWIPYYERMPEEHDSIFKKFYGTSKWDKCMWLKNSDEVNVTSELKDGTRITEYSYTHDGKWCFLSDVVERKVVAWRPLPEPYRPQELNNVDEDTAQCGSQSVI